MFNLNKISLQIWSCMFFLTLLVINFIFKVIDKELNIGLIVLSYGMLMAHISNRKKKVSLEKEKLK